MWKKTLQPLDISSFFIYNNKAYWKDDENIYRCPIVNGQLDLKNKEYVHPTSLYDINYMDYLLITQELESI